MEKNVSNEKRNNFKRISENRVNKIITLLNQMQNLTNRSFYEYDEEDIERIFSVLEKEMESTKTILLNENRRKGKKFIL